MDPASVNKAASALSTAVAKEAQAGGQTIENRTKEMAPGLSTGAFAPGGYTYNRVTKDVVPVLQSALVVAAKQALFRQAAKNAMNDAQVAYDAARSRANQRQRDAQKKAAEEAERKQAEYDKMMKSYYSGGGSGGGSGSSSSNTISGNGGTSKVGSFNVVNTGAPPRLTMAPAQKHAPLTMAKPKKYAPLKVVKAKPRAPLTMAKPKTYNLTMR